jgi:crossover junction endodeoxyribonuclease RuvC
LKILGIDPGIAITGFGIIEFDGYDFEMLEYGCIRTEKTLTHQERISQVITDLNDIINEFQPDQISIEEIFFNKNVKTGIQVAECRGAVIYHLGQKGFTINQYKPLQVKSNICGYGGAKKDQVQRMVQMLLKLTDIPKPDDAADALALAICHANNLKQLSLIHQ